MSRSHDGVLSTSVSKSQEGLLSRGDIDSFDYHKFTQGSKTRNDTSGQTERKNGFLPQLPEPHKRGTSYLNGNDGQTETVIKQSRKGPTKDENSLEEINPDVVQLGWKDSSKHPREAVKRTTSKLKKTRKPIDDAEEVEGHLRFQNGVLLPKKSYKG